MSDDQTIHLRFGRERITPQRLAELVPNPFAERYPLDPDETIPLTDFQRAVVREQQAHLGIAVDGDLGPQTWCALGSVDGSVGRETWWLLTDAPWWRRMRLRPRPCALAAGEVAVMDLSISAAVQELDQIAREAKAGTEHEDHDGWSTGPFPSRDLVCGCGTVLVGSSISPAGVLRVAPDGRVYEEELKP